MMHSGHSLFSNARSYYTSRNPFWRFVFFFFFPRALRKLIQNHQQEGQLPSDAVVREAYEKSWAITRWLFPFTQVFGVSVEQLLNYDKLRSIITSDRFPNGLLVTYNNVNLLEQDLNFLDENNHTIQNCLKSSDQQMLYAYACEDGRLDVVKYIETKISNENQESGQMYAYQRACANGHLDIVKYLGPKLSNNEIKAAIQDWGFDAYRWACKNGHLDVVKHLETKVPNEVKRLIEYRNYQAYRWTCKNGHLDVVKHLGTQLSNDEIKAAIQACDYDAYRWACKNGHLDVVKYLETKLSETEIKAAIQACDYDAYRAACKNGHLDVVKHLGTKLSNDEIKAAIKAFNYEAYLAACANGHLNILEHLETKIPDEVKRLIKYNNYKAYRWACKNGHLDVVKYLETILSTDEIKTVIKKNSYYAYQKACGNGLLSIIKHLETKIPDEIQDAIKATHYGAYRWACGNGHLDVVKYLEPNIPDEIQDAIRAEQYDSYCWACGNGHLDIVKHLETNIPDEIQQAIQARDYRAYHNARSHGHLEVIKHLLDNPACFAYAEKHDRKYGKKYIYDHADLKIKLIKDAQCSFEYQNPIGVFDISETEAQYGFYLLRNLIRRSVDRTYDNETRAAEPVADSIRFLLSIPAIQTLCHQNVTVDTDSPGEDNELLRLALQLKSAEAVQILLPFKDSYKFITQAYREGSLTIPEKQFCKKILDQHHAKSLTAFACAFFYRQKKFNPKLENEGKDPRSPASIINHDVMREIARHVRRI